MHRKQMHTGRTTTRPDEPFTSFWQRIKKALSLKPRQER